MSHRARVAVAAKALDAIVRFVEAKIREAESVLHAMRGQERRDVLRIAIAQDQRDDRLRRNGIESGGGRIVKNDRRAIDQRARHRNAATHAAGKLRGIFFDRIFHFDEPQHLAHARSTSSSGHVVLAQPKADVFRDRERIEQRALLKNESDPAPKIEQLFLAHFADFVPITQNLVPSRRCIKPAASFMISVLPEPLSPSRTFVSPGEDLKRNALRTSPSSKPMRTSLKTISGSPGAQVRHRRQPDRHPNLQFISCKTDGRRCAYDGNAPRRRSREGRENHPRIIDGNQADSQSMDFGCVGIVYRREHGTSHAHGGKLICERRTAAMRERKKSPTRISTEEMTTADGGGAADALRAAADAQALIASDRRDNQGENQGLREALDEIAEFERVNGARPELHRARGAA